MNLNQVTIAVTDIERSITFYQQLGLHLIVHSGDHYARFECPVGGSTFSLHTVPEVTTPQQCSVYFEVPDVDAKERELLEKNIEIELPPTDQRWLWREMHLRDPDGHSIIIYHAGANRVNPPWRLTT